MRFSIVIPVHNGEQTISRAIQSCLKQTYTQLELVVVDNRSSDGTPGLIRKHHADTRLKHVYTDTLGRSHARNVGLDASRGDYVLFLDADDELAPHALMTFNCILMQRGDCQAVQCATKYIEFGAAERMAPPYPGRRFYEKLHIRNTIPINSMVIARDRCARFPEDTEFCEDWHFWLESLRGVRVGTAPDLTSIVHVQERSASQNKVLMKCHEIPVHLTFLRDRLPISYALKRAMLIFLAVAVYSDADKIERVEASLASHLIWARLSRGLRARPGLRLRLRSLIRRRFEL